MIKAVIYDMDGVLIDSEPLWTIAEIYVFAQVGIKLNDELRNPTRGLREDQVVDYWFERFPWSDKSKADILTIIIDKVIELISAQGEPNKGALASLDFFAGKNIKLAVASSSYETIIEAVLSKFAIRDKFDCVYSAEHEAFGKPDPGVYLTTAAKLSVEPTDCLCIEDSVNGLLAAKSAGMSCIVIPNDYIEDDVQFSQADLILNSLTEVDETLWNKLN